MDRSAAPLAPAAPGAAGQLTTTAPSETRALGRAIGEASTPGTLLALRGPLGAGKTQLAKGVAEGLGIATVVNSPTFILMNEHAGRLRLYHVDAYRLDDPEEALAAGLLDRERQASGVTVVEWADRLDGYLPEDRLDVELTPDARGGDERTIRWQTIGEVDRAIVDALETR